MHLLDEAGHDWLMSLLDSEKTKAPESTVLHADAADPSRHLTRASTKRQLRKVAHVLRHQYGIGASGPSTDVVFLISTGHFLLPLLFYGTVAAEGVFSSTSPAATPEELAYQLKATGAKIVFATDATKGTAIAAAKKVGLPVSRVLVYRGEKEIQLFEAASGAVIPISNQEMQWRRITNKHELENSTICLLFSSGTTGLPKAMRLSHANMVAAGTLLLEPLKDYNRKNRPRDFEYISLAHLPVAHIAGVQGYLVNSVYMGGTLYWMSHFDFPKFCQYFKMYKATSLFTVPPIYLLISKSPLVTDHFDTWVDAVSGAAPMGEDLEAEVSKKLGKGKTKLRQTWGLSETTGSITTVPIEETNPKPGTVGGMVANHDARLIDDDGNDVEPGKEGEIIVRGPVVIKGYWHNDKANAEAFKNGWFYTGDIGVFRDGWFWIVDRKKVLVLQALRLRSVD
jgi:4-coumarate--CoA ligase